MCDNILVYGSNGYIGSNICNFLIKKSNINVIKGKSRCDNYNDVNNEIINTNADRVLCCIGKSSGKNIYSTSFIENKLDINLNNNLYSQLVLIKCCNENNIHLTHIGDGCIFNEEDNKIFDEFDEPNLKCSAHSIVKSYTEKLSNYFQIIICMLE